MTISSSWTVLDGDVTQVGGRRKRGRNGGRAKQREKIRKRLQETGLTTIAWVK